MVCFEEAEGFACSRAGTIKTCSANAVLRKALLLRRARRIGEAMTSVDWNLAQASTRMLSFSTEDFDMSNVRRKALDGYVDSTPDWRLS